MDISAPQVLLKQPGELREYSMDFSNLLGANESISSVNSITSMLIGGGTSDLTIGSSSDADGIVSFNISGGTHNKRYRVEVTVTTSLSNILEGDGILKVMDH